MSLHVDLRYEPVVQVEKERVVKPSKRRRDESPRPARDPEPMGRLTRAPTLRHRSGRPSGYQRENTVVPADIQPLASSPTQLSSGASITDNVEGRLLLARDAQALGQEMTIIRRASARTEEIYTRIQERYGHV